jgi:hypothetical protein
MKFCTKSVFLLSALALTAGVSQAQEMKAADPVATTVQAVTPEQDAPVNTSYRADPEWLPKRDPEKGLIVVFRESRFVGGGVKFKLYSDGTALPPLKNGSFIYAYLPPGDHKIYTDKKKQKDARILEVEPGQVYFFEATIAMGMWKGSLDLLETDAEVAKQKMEKLKKPVAPVVKK